MSARLRYIFIVLCCTGIQAYGQVLARYFPMDIPMRDGKFLAADLYASDTTVAKPVILIQTPYNKAPYRLLLANPVLSGGGGIPYDSAHYNYLILDWRGRFASSGAASGTAKVGEDGYDAVEWAAAQPWCNGKVGTHGGSALGVVQFQTAKENPPHLVCAVPMIADYKTEYSDYYYGGVLRREQVEQLENLQFVTVALVTDHPTYDIYWKGAELLTDFPSSFRVPMLMISGWFDHYPDAVLRAFYDIREKSDASVRGKHKLLFGPWTHTGLSSSKQGELEFPNAADEAVTTAKAFFDYHLRGIANDWDNEPVLRYYQLGENEWRTTTDFYDLKKGTMTYYLRPGGELAASNTQDSAAIDFPYDPRDPSPSIGSARFNPFDPNTPSGPCDQAPIINRPDALVYTTPVFASDLELVGKTVATLYLSSDRTDTDVCVRLCDVYPDGRSIILADGTKRMRFRTSVEQESLINPGQAYPVSVDLQNLAVTFKQGHRLRIIVTSSDYPRFDINLNNGGAMYVAGDTLVAANTLHFGGNTLSRIEFGISSPVSVEGSPVNAASEYAILAVYPNPVASQATVEFAVPEATELRFEVYDVFGRRLYATEPASYAPGAHAASLAPSLANGLYFLRMNAGRAATVMSRMVVEK